MKSHLQSERLDVYESVTREEVVGDGRGGGVGGW
jgi:hypothetical protein